jgi:hypothetical protein
VSVVSLNPFVRNVRLTKFCHIRSISHPFKQRLLVISTQKEQKPGDQDGMKKLSFVLLATVVVILVGGGAFLAGWDIPAPQKRIEKVLPDDSFKN